MTINYATSYQSALQDLFRAQGLFSADLWNSPSNALLRWDGVKHVKVPRLTIDEGMKDRTRREISGFGANYSNDYDDYELTNERYWQTLVDPIDVDETNQILSIANITQAFNVQQKMPEKDRFMFSKLFKSKVAIDGAASKDIVSEALTEDNILDVFDNWMADFAENNVSGQLQLYVTPQTHKLLKGAQAKNRVLQLSDSGNIDRRVYSLDDVQIKEVPSNLMHTAYDFTVGSAPVEGSKQIDMFLIANGVQIAPEKYAFSGLQAPEALTAGNWLYYEQLYNDVFLLKQKAVGIKFAVSDRAASNG